MLSTQVERWATYWPDAKPLWETHWQAIAVDQEQIPLDVDTDAYAALDAAGILHIVTLRDEGRLVGYHASFVRPHLHYKSALHAFVDVYWVEPAYRKGLTGYTFFLTVERTLRARGVVKMISACKLHHDVSALFARQGWCKTEQTWTKVLGGSPW